MAISNIDLSSEIQDWKEAICGEEVRAANVSAFEKIQGSVNSAIVEVNLASLSVQRATEDIEDLIAQADETLEQATEAKNIASEKASQTMSDAAAAKAAADKAELYAGFVVPDFYVNYTNGHLEYSSATDIVFIIDTATGSLNYSYT